MVEAFVVDYPARGEALNYGLAGLARLRAAR